MGAEVGWHLRFSREDELSFLVQAKLTPNVEDAVFMAGDWLLTWSDTGEGPDLRLAVARRKKPRGGAA